MKKKKRRLSWRLRSISFQRPRARFRRFLFRLVDRFIFNSLRSPWARLRRRWRGSPPGCSPFRSRRRSWWNFRRRRCTRTRGCARRRAGRSARRGSRTTWTGSSRTRPRRAATASPGPARPRPRFPRVASPAPPRPTPTPPRRPPVPRRRPRRRRALGGALGKRRHRRTPRPSEAHAPVPGAVRLEDVPILRDVPESRVGSNLTRDVAAFRLGGASDRVALVARGVARDPRVREHLLRRHARLGVVRQAPRDEILRLRAQRPTGVVVPVLVSEPREPSRDAFVHLARLPPLERRPPDEALVRQNPHGPAVHLRPVPALVRRPQRVPPRLIARHDLGRHVHRGAQPRDAPVLPEIRREPQVGQLAPVVRLAEE